MAPHADVDGTDVSGYTLNQEKVEALQQLLKSIATNAGNIDLGATVRVTAPVDSHDRDEPEQEHIHVFNLLEIQELFDAVSVFEATKLPLNKLTPECFPLPTLSQKLRKFSVQLPRSQPFFLLRGLKPAWYTKEKLVMLFTGIASYVGTKRAMTGGDPHVLQHITAMDVPKDGPSSVYCGPPNRTMAIPFHTDYGDIISLFTVCNAASGGSFYLANVNDIVSYLIQTRPDIVTQLQEVWHIINPNAECGYDARPLLYKLSSGEFAISASRARLTGTPTRPRPEHMAPLSNLQLESLDALHAVGKQVAERFNFRSGDVIFYDNRRMMHARDAYVDGDEENNQTKRYLLRLILKDERNASQWELPPQLKDVWSELYDHELEEEVFSVHKELFSYKISHG
jgi:hypothetical protein